MEQFTTLLSLQGNAVIITLIGTAAVVFTVLFLFFTAGKSDDDNTASDKVYKFRRKYFWSLFAIVLAGFLTSLTLLPYGNKEDTVDNTISVLAFQWGWKLAYGDEVTTVDDLMDFQGRIRIDVKLNDNIKFIVAARDVNHSFGIYNEEGFMINQVQAMPGYFNELYHKFDEVGVYKVFCMEYCGLAHARMVATITVTEEGPVIEEKVEKEVEVMNEIISGIDEGDSDEDGEEDTSEVATEEETEELVTE